MILYATALCLHTCCLLYMLSTWCPATVQRGLPALTASIYYCSATPRMSAASMSRPNVCMAQVIRITPALWVQSKIKIKIKYMQNSIKSLKMHPGRPTLDFIQSVITSSWLRNEI